MALAKWPLAWAPLLLLAGAFKDAQRWVYNATLFWDDMMEEDPVYGPDLKVVAMQFTETISLFYRTFTEFCITAPSSDPDGLCHAAGDCWLERVRAVVPRVHEVFASNLGRLHEGWGGPGLEGVKGHEGPSAIPARVLLARPEGQGGQNNIRDIAGKLLDVTAVLGHVPGCDELADQLEPREGEGLCGPMMIFTGLACVRSFSDVAQIFMPLLHAAQIAASLPAGVPWPREVVFESHRGMERARILQSLLDERLQQRPTLELRAAEIGVDDGRTSVELLENVPLLTLLLVDPFEGADVAYFQRHSKDFALGGAEQVWDRVRPFRNRSILIPQLSVPAASLIAPGSLDLVFVDADHSYESVRDDLRAWYPKLASAGVMAGHDYSLHWTGVIRAVHEFAEELGVGVSLGPDHMWWIHRVA